MTNVRLHKYIWFCCDCITNIVCSTGCTSDYAEIVEEEGDYSTPMSKFLTSQFRGDSKEILSVNLIANRNAYVIFEETVFDKLFTIIKNLWKIEINLSSVIAILRSNLNFFSWKNA